MDTHELLMTALRGLGVYLLILVVVRISGKRTVGNFSAFDLIVALMLGEVVDEIIYGDVTFLQGGIAIGVVALAHYANSWLSYVNPRLNRFLEGKPTVLVRDGRLARDGMRKERMNEKDVMAELRLHGIDDLREVRLGIMENDGEMSVILHDWAEPLQKSDLGGEAAGEKEKATGGKEDPPDGKKSSSPWALGEA